MTGEKTLKEIELHLQEIMRIIEDISSSTEVIYNTNLKFSGEIEEINKILENMFAKIQLFVEAAGTIVDRVSSSRITLEKTTSTLEKMVSYYKALLSSSEKALRGFEELETMGTRIFELLERLESINKTSLSTARNAEIKAYHAGEGGKGFEIVARELGEFTKKSIALVEDIMETIKTLKEESILVREHFKKFEEPIQKLEKGVASLNDGIEYIKESFKSIEEYSKLVGEEGEKQDRMRAELQRFTGELSTLSQKLLLNSSRANFITGQKITMGEILSFLFEQLRNTSGNETLEGIAKKKFVAHLIILSSLIDIIITELSSIDVSKMRQSLKLKDIDRLKEIIVRQENLSKEIASYADEAIGAAKRLGENLEKMEEMNKSLLEKIEEIDKSLQRVIEGFNKLKKQGRNTVSATENLRILSLYAKLEAVRAEDENLLVIVEQMAELSSQFKSASREIEDFVKGIKESIFSTNEGISEMGAYVGETGKNLLQSEQLLSEAEEGISYITSISNELIDTINQQKEITDSFLGTITRISSEMESNIRIYSDLQSGLREEKGEVGALTSLLPFREFHIPEKTFTLYLNSDGDPINLDPAYIGDATSNFFVNQLYRGLFEFGFSARVYATLPEFVKISENGRRISIRLKRGIKAHNGSLITAEDVVFSFKRVMNSPNAVFFEAVEDIKVIDNFTFEISLKYPYIPLFSNLATIAGSIIPQDAGNLDLHPIGIGPYRFVEWQKGKEFRLERFSEYTGGSGYADEIVIKIIPDNDEVIERFKAGELDIVSLGLSSIPKLEKDPELKARMIRVNSLDIQYFGFCFNKIDETPFKDVRVRRAMSYMIDREKYLEILYMGHGIPAKGLFPPGLDTYNPSLRGYEYNPEKAKELLREAGYPDGLPDKYYLDISSSKVNIRRAEVLADQFKQFGINLEIRTRPWGEFLDFVHRGEAIMFLLGWNTDNGDPDNFLFPLFHSKSIGEGGNSTYYSNPEVDRLIELGMQELNPQRRIEIYREAERKILEDAPMIFLSHKYDIYLVQDDIMGFKPNPISHGTHYEHVYKEL